MLLGSASVAIEADLGPLEAGLAEAKREVDVFDKQMSQSKAGADTLKLANHELQNLTAQFSDLGVQLASGGSPFMAILQQGSQVAYVLGARGGGLRGAVSALTQGFAAMLTPLNLAVVGLAAASAAVPALYNAITSGGGRVADTLSEHEALIRKIKEAYGDAAEGVKEYANESYTVLSFQAQQNVSNLTDTLRGQLDDLVSEFTGYDSALLRFADSLTFGNLVGAENFAAFEHFRGIIQGFVDDVRAGEADVGAFRREVAAFASSTDSTELRNFAQQILDTTQAARDSESALLAAKDLIAGLAGVAGSGAGNVNAFADAMGRLGNIALPRLSDMEQAYKAYDEALKSASGTEERFAAAAGLRSALGRITAANTPVPSGKPLDLGRSPLRGGGGGGGRNQSDFQSEITSVREMIAALEIEAATYGMTTSAAAAYRVEQQLLNAAQADGTAATRAEQEAIAQLVQQYQAANDNVEQLREAEQRRNQALNDFKGLASGTLSSFLKDLKNGTNAADALASAVSRVGDRLIDIAVNNLVERAFGGLGGSGGGGGLFGGILSLFGGFRANGGDVDAGKAYVVGERGRELFIPRQSGHIVSNERMRSGGGGAVVNINVDATGADPAGLARVERQLAEMQRTLPEQIVAVQGQQATRAVV